MDKIKVNIRMNTLLCDTINILQEIYLTHEAVDSNDEKITKQTILLKLLFHGMLATLDDAIAISLGPDKGKLATIKHSFLSPLADDNADSRDKVRTFYIEEDLYYAIQTLLLIENAVLKQGLKYHNLIKGLLINGIRYYIYILKVLLNSDILESSLNERFLKELKWIDTVVEKYEISGGLSGP